MHRRTVHILLIAGIVIAVYSNTLRVPFQFDDLLYIVDNPVIKDLRFFAQPSTARKFEIYPSFISRFIGYLTFALNYRMHGLDVTGYHIVNVAVHLFNALLVYCLALLTFQTPRLSTIIQFSHPSFAKGGRRGIYIALFSSLLFAAHPVQTQAVTYITQRFTSLMALFFLLSLVLYALWRLRAPSPAESNGPSPEAPGRASRRLLLYAGALVSTALAMKTKENAFTLPVIIALYEVAFFDGDWRKRMRNLLPFFAAMLIIPLGLLHTDGPMLQRLDLATRAESDMPRTVYLYTQLRVLVTYFRLLFLPVQQNLDCDYHVFHSLFDGEVFLSFLLHALLLGAGVYLYRRSRRRPNAKMLIAAFGIFWFYLTLSVESSVIPTKDMIFEHRLYLPSVGVFFALSTLALWPRATAGKGSVGKYVALIACAAVVLALSGMAYARNGIWENEVTLWSDVVSKSPRKARPHIWLGTAYKDLGLNGPALREFQIAVALDPSDARARNNLGLLFAKQGGYEDALREYRLAMELKPYNADIYSNIGVLYADHGRFEEAVQALRTAVRLKPYDADLHNNLGVIYEQMGRHEDALRAFQVALDLNPGDADIQRNLGKVLGKKSGEKTP